jgi:hypothetical protein
VQLEFLAMLYGITISLLRQQQALETERIVGPYRRVSGSGGAAPTRTQEAGGYLYAREEHNDDWW